MVWRFFALIFLLGCQFRGCQFLAKDPILRVVTWNVGDNAKMQKKPTDPGFTDEAIDRLLDLDLSDHRQIADIFAVSLQEECWKCNSADLKAEAIPNVFLRRLVARKFGDYEIVGIQGTRDRSDCVESCKTGSHGTTAVFVIAKKGIVSRHKAFKHIAGCSDKTPPNEEKGLAAMRLELKTGKSVCVASTHLESRSPDWRRKCFSNFFDPKAKNDLEWRDCNFKFIAGDFNTRTAGSAPPNQISHLAEETKMPASADLRTKDEMAGKSPFLGDKIKDSLNLLSYINKHQKSVFEESAFTFLPTYKLTDAKKDCGGKRVCYKSSHPQSWTDRVIHSGGKSLKYDAIYLMHERDWSDHLPVFQVFQL